MYITERDVEKANNETLPQLTLIYAYFIYSFPVSLQGQNAHLANMSSLPVAPQALLLHLSIYNHPTQIFFWWKFRYDLQCHQSGMKELIYHVEN